MIFTDAPTPVPKEMYQDAAQLYAGKIMNRAKAVYQVGTVPFPGISDLDMLVVVDLVRRDNSQFFSAFDRLPNRCHHLFLHQPFILPETALDVIQHTSHDKRLLLAGSDVLRTVQSLYTNEERWCRLLESYCNFDVYVSQCLARQRAVGRLAVAVASSMRYALRDFDAIFLTHHADSYGREIDKRRALLGSQPAKGQTLISEIWNMLYAKLQWLRGRLMETLPVNQGQSLRDSIAEFLAGRLLFDSLDSAAIARRRSAIDFYHAELHRLRFSFGHLFFFAAYDTASQRFHQSRVERTLFSLFYRTRDLTAF